MIEVSRSLYRAGLLVVLAATVFTFGCAKKPVASTPPPSHNVAPPPAQPTVSLQADPTSVEKGDPSTLEISMDTKAKVSEGDYARGGKNPDGFGREAGPGLGS